MTTTRVYLDNAASTPLDPRVLEAMLPYFTEQYGNPSSVHHHGRQLRAAIEKARKTVAEILNCAPAEIVFTSGGTEADNYALRSSVIGLGLKHIITSPLEHHAVGHTVDQLAQQLGITYTMLTPDAKGNLDLNELEDALKRNPKSFVSLMHGNNEVGTLNNIQAIGELSRQHGAVFHTDTTQTAGHLPLNLQTLPADFLVASAHKFYGPKGVGFLFRREGMAIPSMVTGGGQERNQRAGTENVAFIVGLAKALELCTTEQQAHLDLFWSLKRRMMDGLKALSPQIDFNGETDRDKALPWVLNVAFPGADEESLMLFNLDLYGISASGGSACTSGSVTPSHVLSALGHTSQRIANSVRFSFGAQNTEAEIDYTLEKLRVILEPVLQHA